MRSAENPTPTWLRFQQLDSASEETATSSSQGRASRIPILLLSIRISQSQQSLRNLQPFSKQFQVVLLPVQWMPFPQYPQRCRKGILHLDNPGHHPGLPKEFHPQGLDYQLQKINSSSSTDISDNPISEREMLRYGSE